MQTAPGLPRSLGPRMRAAARAYPRSYWAMLAGYFVGFGGVNVIWPFVSMYARQAFDVPLTRITIVFTLYAAFSAFATMLAGAERWEGTLSQTRLSPIARALRAHPAGLTGPVAVDTLHASTSRLPRKGLTGMAKKTEASKPKTARKAAKPAKTKAKKAAKPGGERAAKAPTKKSKAAKTAAKKPTAMAP